MLKATRRFVLAITGAAVLVASLIALASAAPGHGPSRPVALAAVQVRGDTMLRGLNPLDAQLRDGRLWAPLSGGKTAELTLDPPLQAHLKGIFARYEVPFGAAVALDPRTGRVLSYVSHSSANPRAGDLVRDPTPPAASVFKVITAAALLDHGVSSNTRVCYSGGLRRISESDLVDQRGDNACATLAQALGGSINTIFAKLADRHLKPAVLSRYAEAFGFGHALPFDVATQPSPSEVPSERLEFARTAAGFWHMHMSPLHAALIGATVANGGVMPRPALVERVLDSEGATLRQFEVEEFRSVIPSSTARVVADMMERTVTHGTARSAFYDQKGNPFLPGISVAGKTGSLSTNGPYRAYSWWVGFAPADKPEIAVAALVVNTPKWRIKGSYVAREALRYYLVEEAPARRAKQVASTR